jgi:microcystin-dependent protein
MTTRIQTFGGNIGIGTDDPGSFKLNVNGDVKADSLVINGVTNSQVPIGLIQIWYGSVESIPTGWVLCNGATGITRSDGGGTIDTPDLTGRFVRGATSTPQVGQTAGNNTVTLSEANLPGHAHTFTSGSSNAPHSHGIDASNHAHTHEVGSGGAQHAHTSGQAAAPHQHPVVALNCIHTHITQNADAPHGHHQPATGYAPHAHNYNSGYPSGAGGGPRRAYVIIPSEILQTDINNVPHNHETNATAFPHKHNYNAAQAPHGHESAQSNANHPHPVTANTSTGHPHAISNANATHTHTIPVNEGTHAHTGTTDSTGQATAVTITNPYYLLAYIMKI